MNANLDDFSLYVLLASCIMMISNGAAFLFGVWDYTRFLSSPDRPADEPLVPNKPLLAGFLTALVIFMISCFLPLIGEHDGIMLRSTLAFSILIFAGAALPCWHLTFAKGADEPELPKANARFYFLATLGLIAWNGLILLANPKIEVAPDNPLNHANLEHPVVLFLFILLALCAPISEEIVYRGVIQTWVGKIARNALVGGIVAGLLFAVAHAGMVAEPGVKELQILGLAALFGWARWKHGLTAAIALHFINNAMALFLHLLALTFDLSPVPPT